MYLLKLWFSIFIIGLIFYPLTSCIFTKFNDKGWIFSKIIGISISAWFMWILSYLKIFQYTQFNSYLILAFFAIINFVIIFKRYKYKKNNSEEFDFSFIKHIIMSEIIFVVCLCFWTYIKGFNPAISSSTEQFMDYGFMNSIMNTKYMPPEDIWLSGHSINYYYFGQYISGFICKVAGLTTSQGYNLIIAFIASCIFALPFSIGYNLFRNKLENITKTKILKFLPLIVALFIGIAVSLGGTMHYPIYRWFSPDKQNYSYGDETRYIGFKPDIADKTATEVPIYSTHVGDLHAHYIDLVFSLTMLALLVQYFLSNEKENNSKNIKSYINLFLVSFILGIQKMTNYWDLPIYLVILGAIIITKNLICGKFNLKSFLKTLGIIVGVIFIEELMTLPFTLDLQVNSANIYFTGVMSQFYKLIVKWGLQSLCVILFLIIFLIKYEKSKQKFKEFLNNNLPDLFIIIIGLCAFGLVIMPEIVYLKDIYGDEFKRFNTMFKLTYQAFLLFSISTSYILFRLSICKNKIICFLSIIVLLIYSFTFGYGIDLMITNYKNREHAEISAYSTESFIRTSLAEDYKAIEWIRKNIDRDKVIVEASKTGNSYSVFSVISTFTGNPTVLGWAYHEWIWRANTDYSIPEELNIRNNDISALYTADDIYTAKNIIKKYNIDYIYIGYNERTTYNVNTELLRNLGKTVYQHSYVELIKVNK